MKRIFKSAIIAILTLEARLLLRRTNPKIVAITGSVGKTSVKDAIFAAIKNEVRARKSEKSYNSDIGVVLTVLGLPNAWNNPFLWIKNIVEGLFIALFPGEYPELLVLEMGVDRPGDMAKLCEWVTPDIVVLTRLPDVPVHVEYFDSPQAVIAEKKVLVDSLKSDGILIYNHDDEQIRKIVEEVRQQSFGFSRYSLSHFTAAADKVMYDDGVPVGFEFTLTHLDTAAVMRVNGSLGVQHAYNYAAAVAVATTLNIPLESSVAALREHEPPAGRMRIIPGLKNTLIIDDTYNSSPIAAERALLSLKELHGHKRKVVVLGDMLELGQYSMVEHEKLGKLAAECCTLLITVGVRARKIAEGALEHGMDEKNILQYDNIDRAANELQQLMREGDMILVKASQGIRAERLVEEIMAEPERAPDLLVRQDPVWKLK